MARLRGMRRFTCQHCGHTQYVQPLRAPTVACAECNRIGTLHFEPKFHAKVVVK